MDEGSKLPFIIAVIILLLLAMYCAVCETAFSACSKSRIKILAERGEPRAKRAMYVLDNFDKAAIMAYVLSAKMPENLSRLSAELRKNEALEAALRWIAANEVPPEITIAVRDLLTHPYSGAADKTDPTNRAPSTTTGGASSSTDSQ